MEEINQKVKEFKEKRKIKFLIILLLVLIVVTAGIIYFFWNNEIKLAMRGRDGKQVDLTIGNKEILDATLDSDGDGLTDVIENRLGTDKNKTDSDNDGIIDGEELMGWGTNPLKLDSDNDGLSDYNEVKAYGTDPLKPDSDEDGFADGWEVFNNFNPKGKGKLE